MECAFHTGKAAAGFCSICNKALCGPCVNRFNPPTCESCVKTRSKKRIRQIRSGLILSAISFILFFIFFKFAIELMAKDMGDVKAPFYAPIMFAYALVSLYWGYKFTESRGSANGLIVTVDLLFIGKFIRLLIGAVIGPYVTPWVIYKMFAELKRNKDLNV